MKKASSTKQNPKLDQVTDLTSSFSTGSLEISNKKLSNEEGKI
jgi:hypothetical protein